MGDLRRAIHECSSGGRGCRHKEFCVTRRLASLPDAWGLETHGRRAELAFGASPARFEHRSPKHIAGCYALRLALIRTQLPGLAGSDSCLPRLTLRVAVPIVVPSDSAWTNLGPANRATIGTVIAGDLALALGPPLCVSGSVEKSPRFCMGAACRDDGDQQSHSEHSEFPYRLCVAHAAEPACRSYMTMPAALLIPAYTMRWPRPITTLISGMQ